MPPAEITENIYAMDTAARKAHGIESLPGSLEEALRALEADQLILDTLGEHVGRQLPDGQVAGVGRVPYPRVLLGAGEVHHQLLRPRGDGGRRL